MASTGTKKKTTKLSLNLPDDDIETLRELAESSQTTMTEVLRRALKHEKMLTDELESQSQVLIKDKAGKTKQLVGWL